MTSSSNPVLFGKPITLDTLPDLFAHHASRFGGWRMDAGDGGTGGDGGQGGDGGDDGGKNKADPPVPDGKVYSAADVTAAIERRVGELTRKHEQALKQVQEDAGKNETERYKAEAERATAAATAAAQKAAPRVAEALAQVSAITLGGRPDRAAAIVRQADLDGVAKFDGDDWTVDETKVQAALEKVLTDYPEWKADAAGDDGKDKGGDKGQQGGGASRSGGDLNGGAGGGDVTLDQFKAMNMTKRGELRQSDPEAYRRLADAEIAAASVARTR